MPDSAPITRDTVMRIALALSSFRPEYLDAEECAQLGVAENMLGVAQDDRCAISKGYEANKSRKIGRYTLSFTASAVLANAEWLGELLGVDMGMDMGVDVGGDTATNEGMADD